MSSFSLRFVVSTICDIFRKQAIIKKYFFSAFFHILKICQKSDKNKLPKHIIYSFEYSSEYYKLNCVNIHGIFFTELHRDD